MRPTRGGPAGKVRQRGLPGSVRPPAPNKRGLLCRCGAVSMVINSRPRNDGRVVYRSRACVACGERFTTYEMRAGDMSGAHLSVDMLRYRLIQTRETVDAVLRQIGADTKTGT